jgi:hypothetical protein
MMNKRELKARKTVLSYQIRNIRADFNGVLKEDMPTEIVDEIATLLAELHEVREALGKE